MSFLDDLQEQVSNTWNDVTSTGVPAIVAGVESYAAAQLNQQAKQNQAAATQAATQVMKQPGPSQGVFKSISDSLSSVGQSAAFKQYGVFIVAGVAVLIVGGIYLGRK